jgi:hypothetical protein
MAGIMGYFVDSAQLGTLPAVWPIDVWPTWVGDWLLLNSTYLQIPQRCGGVTGNSFIHTNQSYWGLSRSEVSLGWSFNPLHIYSAMPSAFFLVRCQVCVFRSTLLDSSTRHRCVSVAHSRTTQGWSAS